MKQVIKYAAIIFALALATTIIGGCLTAGISVVRMIVEKTGDNFNSEAGEGIWYRTEDGDVVFMGIRFGGKGNVKSGSNQFERSEIKALDIEGMSGELIIEAWDGDSFSVVYENIAEDYEILNIDGTLTVQYDDNLFVWGASFTEMPKITVQVPKGVLLDSAMIEKGSGSARISEIAAKTLRIDSGSGTVTVSDVEADETKIDSGSGAVTVKDSGLGETVLDTGSGFVNFKNVISKNLVVDSGSGRIDYEGSLSGNCVFETGSGSVNLEVYGNKEDYNIRADLGSGGLYINGAKEKDTDIKYDGAANWLILN